MYFWKEHLYVCIFRSSFKIMYFPINILISEVSKPVGGSQVVLIPLDEAFTVFFCKEQK